MRHEIVVFDPEGAIPEGKVFRQDAELAAMKRNAVVTIPTIQPSARRLLSFSKSLFGDGLEVSETIPNYVGSAGLLLQPRVQADRVSWAAMLRHAPGVARGGEVRLVGDPRCAPFGQGPVSDDPGNRASVVSGVQMSSSLAVVTGVVPCQVPAEGFYAFALHGWARGCRLVWLAVSQAE
jgi:hypothetical protein